MAQDLFDVTIIGGGPAGMYTAFYSGMRDLKTKIIDCNSQLGGKVLLYPEKMIWDVGGVTPIRGSRLVEQLVEQAKTFAPTIALKQKIVDLQKQEDGNFLLTAATGEKHYSKTVILALGSGVLVPRKLEISGADCYEITNLHYTVQELEIYRGKQVLISGGGNSAVDWANELEPIAKKVTVVHRRDEFGGHEKNVAKMKTSSIHLLTPYELKELHGNGSEIEEVTVINVETGIAETVKVDAVVVNHGMMGDLAFLEKWGIAVNGYTIDVNERMETSIPGVFAAGDLVKHGSKVHLIAGTFVDGVNALNSAKLYLEPEAEAVAYVSSHNERFKEKNKLLGVTE